MDIKNITVLGSGVMGHGIAQVSATAGYDVELQDAKLAFLDNVKLFELRKKITVSSPNSTVIPKTLTDVQEIYNG